MAKYTSLPRAFVRETSTRLKQNFDLDKFIKTSLGTLNVAFIDDCCADATLDALVPTRYNVTTGTIERYNPTTDAWVATDDSATIATGLTALAGGGQTGATALVQGVNEVTTVATAADSVKLPTAVAGLRVIVKNDGAAALAVFPFLADTIDDGSANASVTVQPGVSVSFTAINTINWESSYEIMQAGSIYLADGTVSNLAIKLGADANNGIYGISDTQLGFAVEGTLMGGFSTTAFFTDAITSQTTNGDLTLSGAGTGRVAVADAVTIISASATALAVGLAGATNPALTVDASTASQVAGLKVVGAVTGGTVAIVATDSGSAASITINAKGSGTIGIGSVSTGIVTITPATTVTGALTATAGIVTGAISNYKTTIGMTATAGGAQAGTALASELNVFSTVATAADSAQLPVAVLGKKVIVRNDAAKAIAVFGQTGDAIDGAAANAAFTLQPGQEVIFEAQSGTTWTTMQGTSLGTISAVTQATSITTGVTVNSKKGIITTFTPSTAALAATTFTVTCNKTTATSNIRAYVTEYGGTVITNGLPYVFVKNQTATSFDIIVYNAHATNALATSLKIGFEIIN